MRLILFRGKAINRNPNYEYRTNYQNGDWVYGLLSKPHNEKYDITAEMTNEDGVSGIDVDYKTIGEWTGLIDKNGVKIFEGDIISKEFYKDPAMTKGKYFKGVVNYKIRSDNGFGDGKDFKNWAAEWNVDFNMGKDQYKYTHYCWGVFFDCEVVGNIYDNPELLEVMI